MICGGCGGAGYLARVCLRLLARDLTGDISGRLDVVVLLLRHNACFDVGSTVWMCLSSSAMSAFSGRCDRSAVIL